MKSRDDVLDAALVQLNRNSASSMVELADAMGISRATLNRHFDTRQALIEELAERGLARWEQAQVAAGILDVEDRDAVETAMIALLRRYVGDAHEFGFLLTDIIVEQVPELAARTDHLVNREADFFARAQAVGLLRRDMPARWFAYTSYGVLVAAREALRAGDVAARGLDDLVITTFLQGVRAHEQ